MNNNIKMKEQQIDSSFQNANQQEEKLIIQT
jgi:hypothetical protein